ncbi:MAG: RusA family crossover junction endodeoxyribonuclease [Clostridia bacterium]|nr:RusA family crossover junction endodeoxyribonuclease [Clostridia bacterium]
MKFYVPMIPPTVTAQMHKVDTRGRKPRFYDPPELVAAKSKLEAHLAKHRPDAPMSGPINLFVMWSFPMTGAHENGEFKTSRPDTDNLQKALKDVMTKLGFWTDDAQVAFEQTVKMWSSNPGLFVTIEELPKTYSEYWEDQYARY